MDLDFQDIEDTDHTLLFKGDLCQLLETQRIARERKNFELSSDTMRFNHFPDQNLIHSERLSFLKRPLCFKSA
ncbi:hypothetical protein SDC9_177616 [bioreactor metagenome]|uniref:Uncharacterized protein n=1 Tax=bioreactor metagenome TaxID=1076179 RepID=A0A645GTH2_9ZZZZ